MYTYYSFIFSLLAVFKSEKISCGKINFQCPFKTTSEFNYKKSIIHMCYRIIITFLTFSICSQITSMIKGLNRIFSASVVTSPPEWFGNTCSGGCIFPVGALGTPNSHICEEGSFLCLVNVLEKTASLHLSNYTQYIRRSLSLKHCMLTIMT